MAEWIYFIHPPRDDFAATMTDEESAVWGIHFERFVRMLAEGSLVLVGPTLGPKNTGISIFEAPDEAAARRIMEEDPVIAGGFARGELRPMRVSLLRGRDEPDRAMLRLARYNRWANERLVAAAATLTDEQRRAPAPGTAGSIALTIAHAIDTELYFAALVDPELPRDEVADDMPWEPLLALVATADGRLVDLLEGLDSPGLSSPVDRDGRTYAARDLLLQALTHAQQHRAQVASALERAGSPAGRIDFVDFVDAGG